MSCSGLAMAEYDDDDDEWKDLRSDEDIERNEEWKSTRSNRGDK